MLQYAKLFSTLNRRRDVKHLAKIIAKIMLKKLLSPMQKSVQKQMLHYAKLFIIHSVQTHSVQRQSSILQKLLPKLGKKNCFLQCKNLCKNRCCIMLNYPLFTQYRHSTEAVKHLAKIIAKNLCKKSQSTESR